MNWIRDFKLNANGLTMIEIMVTLVIVATCAGLLLNKFGNNKGAEQKKFVREFQVLSKEIQYNAKLFNSSYRLAINLDTGVKGEAKQSIWVEKSNEQGVVIDGTQGTVAKDGSVETGSGFQLDTRLFKKPKTLPTGLFINDIELSRADKSYTEGIGYIYFFPQGLVDEAAIHFTATGSEKIEIQWTVYTQPLTGKAYFVGRDLKLKELRDR